MRIIDQIANSGTIIVYTDNLFSDISKKDVFVNESQIFEGSTTSIYFEVLQEVSPLPGRAILKINNLTTGTCYNVTSTMFTNPSVEFWKTDFEPAALDKSLQGGIWNEGVAIEALGLSSSDVIIDGDKFMSPNVDFAPEEFVPGHTTDSLGINVYTSDNETFATVISGSFPVVAGTTVTSQVTVLNDSPSGFLLNFNGKLFDRSTTTNFTSSTQFYVQGQSIILPPQTTSGRAGFSFITVGGTGILDDNTVEVFLTSTNYVIVSSLAAVEDVRSVYVLVDGKEVNAVSTTTDYGYMIKPDWEDYRRASVYVYNLPSGFHTISAWFFNLDTVKINRIREEYFYITSTTSVLTLTNNLGDWQPFSDKAIVEIGPGIISSSRKRLEPPHVSNYTVQNKQTTFNFYDVGTNTGTFVVEDILVYANGTKIRSGYDYNLNLTNNTVNLLPNLYPNGTYISIVPLKDNTGAVYYDYIITDNLLQLTQSYTTSTVKVTTFSNHDKLFMETEKFKWNNARRFTFPRPIVDANYIWVYVDGTPLIHRYDFIVLDDLKTIEIDNNKIFDNPLEVIVTSFKRPETGGKIYAFRIFNDFYDRTSYKRLSKGNTTILTDYLEENQDSIKVLNSNVLSPSNPTRNIPGVVLIDRERIEFFGRGDNLLYQLRRGTGGTGPSLINQDGTKVIDQGIYQTIPGASDTFYTFTTTTNNTSSYVIPIFSTSNFSSFGWTGITLNQGVSAIDQVKVFYGGFPLSKNSREVYTSLTSTELVTLSPEFSINTSTQEIMLNIGNRLEPGVTLSIVQKLGQVFTQTESLITSQVRQAKFLRQFEAELPDVYFYGGDARLLDVNYEPITDENFETIRIE